jgi:hypothetical protein
MPRAVDWREINQMCNDHPCHAYQGYLNRYMSSGRCYRLSHEDFHAVAMALEKVAATIESYISEAAQLHGKGYLYAARHEAEQARQIAEVGSIIKKMLCLAKEQ